MPCEAYAGRVTALWYDAASVVITGTYILGTGHLGGHQQRPGRRQVQGLSTRPGAEQGPFVAFPFLHTTSNRTGMKYFVVCDMACRFGVDSRTGSVHDVFVNGNKPKETNMTNHRLVKIEITIRDNTPNGVADGTAVYHAMAADQAARDLFGACMGRGPSEQHAVNDFLFRARNSGVDTYGIDREIVSRVDRRQRSV